MLSFDWLPEEFDLDEVVLAESFINVTASTVGDQQQQQQQQRVLQWTEAGDGFVMINWFMFFDLFYFEIVQ